MFIMQTDLNYEYSLRINFPVANAEVMDAITDERWIGNRYNSGPLLAHGYRALISRTGVTKTLCRRRKDFSQR